MPTQTETQPENKLDFDQWKHHLAMICAMGEPFFENGAFSMGFNDENEIFTINLTRKPNNILEFPKKEQNK